MRGYALDGGEHRRILGELAARRLSGGANDTGRIAGRAGN